MKLVVTEQQQLVLETLDFARMLARKFFIDRRECGFHLDEFESAAFLGLCDAARRYDPTSEVTFKGFSYLRIQGEMADLLRAGGSTTRKQVRALANIFNEPTDPETLKRILSTLKVDLRYFQELVNNAGIKLHFNDANQVSDISYADAKDPERLLRDKSLCEYLKRLVCQLPDKERLVVELKYFEDLTFEEMREQFKGATRSWLCRIHTRAIENLRNLILESKTENDTFIEAA